MKIHISEYITSPAEGDYFGDTSREWGTCLRLTVEPRKKKAFWQIQEKHNSDGISIDIWEGHTLEFKTDPIPGLLAINGPVIKEFIQKMEPHILTLFEIHQEEAIDEERKEEAIAELEIGFHNLYRDWINSDIHVIEFYDFMYHVDLRSWITVQERFPFDLETFLGRLNYDGYLIIDPEDSIYKEVLIRRFIEEKLPLSLINLRGANLEGFDLAKADLRDADLQEANLQMAVLDTAKATHANLRGANLTHADLIETDLRGADLRSANLTHANLTGADLRMTDITFTTFTGADLSQAELSEFRAGIDYREAILRIAKDTRIDRKILEALSDAETNPTTPRKD